jgi:CheY-like chemotaxis protein
LFTSGYTENAIVHGGRLDEGIELLSKPYTREALARKIRHVLRNQQQRRFGRVEPRHPLQDNVEENPAPVSPPRALRVLLIEDDALIRLSTAEMLADLGHLVDEAGNGNEALDRLDAHDFDVLITDIRLPGLAGDELAAQAIARQPRLRVVFASGYEVLPKSDAREELAGAILLQKPYNERGLADALNAAMAPARAARGGPT